MKRGLVFLFIVILSSVVVAMSPSDECSVWDSTNSLCIISPNSLSVVERDSYFEATGILKFKGEGFLGVQVVNATDITEYRKALTNFANETPFSVRVPTASMPIDNTTIINIIWTDTSGKVLASVSSETFHVVAFKEKEETPQAKEYTYDVDTPQEPKEKLFFHQRISKAIISWIQRMQF